MAEVIIEDELFISAKCPKTLRSKDKCAWNRGEPGNLVCRESCTSTVLALTLGEVKVRAEIGVQLAMGAIDEIADTVFAEFVGAPMYYGPDLQRLSFEKRRTRVSPLNLSAPTRKSKSTRVAGVITNLKKHKTVALERRLWICQRTMQTGVESNGSGHPLVEPMWCRGEMGGGIEETRATCHTSRKAIIWSQANTATNSSCAHLHHRSRTCGAWQAVGIPNAT
ncbi:hypothetical protein B0H17DRAFT_1230282 [Mycena rosella]|uniref:Uncharacterized protein n=1 Tax=Mycena rosella TaxID=1033263 RepID=A0AAD7D759_MYCRO|nr:hypothetical protein B0H17DRAFT_1230282 [Mycena rosella]